jgi:NAD(P)H-hydrate epimerase
MRREVYFLRIVTSAEMAEIESACYASHNLSDEQLAENAGFKIASIIDRLEPESPVALLCGPGNNGADGLIAAFYLASEFAIDAVVILAVDPENLRPIGKKAYRRLAETDVAIHVPGSRNYEPSLERIATYDYVVDCLLGTGQKGPPRGEVARALEALGLHGRVIVVDVPTGIDSDTGEPLGPHVQPFLTLCLGYPKRYLFTGEGRKYAINWKLVPIGIPDENYFGAQYPDLIGEELAEMLPERSAFAHKRDSMVLAVCGSREYSGAAALVASSAMRMGSGMVVAAGPAEGLGAVRARMIEAPVVELDSKDGQIASSAFEALSPWTQQAKAIVVGPGLGRSADVGECVEKLLATDTSAPRVIDGDALFHLAERRIVPKGSCLLTPHSGEAAKLLDDSVENIDAHRFEAASEISKKFSQTVVLKGLHSIIVDRNFNFSVCATGSPLLATAGSGDVLSGMLGALIAQGKNVIDAARLGVAIHGFLGEINSARMGPRTYGVLASELAEEIPAVVALLQEGGLYPNCLELLAPSIDEEDYDEKMS